MRAPGTGTIEKLPSGRFRPQLPGKKGKKLPARDTYDDAARDLAVALALIREEGLRAIEPGTTLGPYGRRVLLARQQHGYRNAGRELSRWASRVEPSDLGKRAVEHVQRIDVVAFIRALSKANAKRGRNHRTHNRRTLSRSVVVDCLRILRAVYAECPCENKCLFLLSFAAFAARSKDARIRRKAAR